MTVIYLAVIKSLYIAISVGPTFNVQFHFSSPLQKILPLTPNIAEWRKRKEKKTGLSPNVALNRVFGLFLSSFFLHFPWWHNLGRGDLSFTQEWAEKLNVVLRGERKIAIFCPNFSRLEVERSLNPKQEDKRSWKIMQNICQRFSFFVCWLMTFCLGGRKK